MFTGMLHTHTFSVMLFLILYLAKTTLLVLNKKETLASFSRKMKVPEMVISTLFFLTGIYLALNSGVIGPWFYIKLLVVFTSIPLAIIAFKRMNKMLALLALMFLVYAYGISETKSPSFRPEDKSAQLAGAGPEELGKAVYETYCISCHGKDGKLGLSGAKDLTQSTMTTIEKIQVVLHGKNAMMPYKKILSDEQVKAVVAFVDAMKSGE